ncbi:hypothetical protein [Massilia sp. S19_KUP03_FR1]|uniref:hypothetical protein n=1 Tax=Massilia sp. S19_KUP03_FR1 TaxID=3025503 RepID=UPI002FCD8766
MRHFIIALLLGCAACASAHAEERRLDSAALQDFTGQYVLQDGRVLTVTQRQRTLAGQLDGRDLVALKPVGPATFASPGGELVLLFDQRRNGNVAAVTVTESGSRALRASH